MTALALPDLDVTIQRYSGVLSAQECARIIEASRPYGEERVPRDGGRLIAHPIDDVDERLGAGILRRLLSVACRVNQGNGWNIPIDIGRAGVSLYRTGDYMALHVDDEERGPRRLWDLPHRGVSMSVLLSGPDEYVGGGLRLFDGHGDGVQIPRADRGDAIVFGSSVPHEVTPVTDGERWVLLLWAYTNHNRRPIR